MANLYSGTIKSNGRYLDLSAETGIVFEVGKRYQIQFCNKGYIREGEIGTGFTVFEANPFTLEYKGDPVYVCSTGKLEINVAE
jgi:hypothetical protein